MQFRQGKEETARSIRPPAEKKMFLVRPDNGGSNRGLCEVRTLRGCLLPHLRGRRIEFQPFNPETAEVNIILVFLPAQ